MPLGTIPFNLLAGVATAAFLVIPPANSAAESEPPAYRNVVLVTLDDLRQDTPGFNGGPAQTPNMDRLASRSTNFTSAMTTVGLCSPSRATLFTGRYGHQTGLDDNCQVWHSRVMGLDANQRTLIEWADDAGYFIGYFGKWHLGTDGPIQRGADRYSKIGFERKATRYYRKPAQYETVRRFYEADRQLEEKPGYYGTRAGTYDDTSDARNTGDACAFVLEAAQSQRPFFLCVGYHAPHPPYVVPKPLDTMYDPSAVKLPANFLHRSPNQPRYQNDALWWWHDVGHLTELDWRRMNSHYYGFVALADQAIGQLLATLDEQQLMDHTMIVLVGDQGSMLGEHALYDKGPYCYDELMRIPLVVYVPGEEPRAVERQVSILDINETIVEWLDLKPDDEPRFSRSLLPLCRGERRVWQDVPDEAFYRYEWYNGRWYGIRAIRTPAWKYCWNPVGIDELYNLVNDPGEMRNQLDEPAVTVIQTDLQQRLLAHLEDTSDPLADRFRQTRLEFLPTKKK